MTGLIETYRVEAYNTAKLSENKMHDDTVARRFGFSGGLVPGVDVMAYMMHLPVRRWGRGFLEHGLIEARFVKPVYDGEITDISGYGKRRRDLDRGRKPRRTVRDRNRLASCGRACLSRSPIIRKPRRYQNASRSASTSYETGQWLGSMPRCWANDAADEYLGDVRERDAIYAREGLGHPGLLQRVMNKVLVDNAILGPWIHVGSRMQLLTPTRRGDELTARAKVTGNYEKKGHRFVELDALVVANGTTPLAHCQHIAIYQPREQAAA